MVQEHVKPAVLKRLRPDQFVCIPGSSTTHTLIGMFHNWSRALGGTGNGVRSFVLDYKKPFDLIDHSLLMAKILQYDINPYIINWIAAFLSRRQQRVELGNDCFSEGRSVCAGVPQGTKMGDLSADTSNSLFKYVDDTTVYEIVDKKGPSHAQSMLNEVCTWSPNNKFQLHPSKCNELRITFARSPTNYELVEIAGCKINTVQVVKLLGVYIQEDLKWNSHVIEMTKKAAKRLYFLAQLKRANVPPEELVQF